MVRGYEPNRDLPTSAESKRVRRRSRHTTKSTTRSIDARALSTVEMRSPFTRREAFSGQAYYLATYRRDTPNRRFLSALIFWCSSLQIEPAAFRLESVGFRGHGGGIRCSTHSELLRANALSAQRKDCRTMPCDNYTTVSVLAPPRGVEPLTGSLQAVDGAKVTDSLETVWRTHWRKTLQDWPDLTVILEAWPKLPQPIRAGIVAMVKAASD